MPPLLVIAGVGVVAVATVAGAWVARRGGQHQDVWFGAAAGALLVIAVFHLLPDAWSDASDAGIPPWLVPLVALASFLLAALISRVGCACEADEQQASRNGRGTGCASLPGRCRACLNRIDHTRGGLGSARPG
ncbi:MAG: hypothetical protein ABR528_13180 [Pseudonocardiaceae bacterium]